MKLRAPTLLAAALALTACGGVNADEENANAVGAPGVEGMGENAVRLNDITSANELEPANGK